MTSISQFIWRSDEEMRAEEVLVPSRVIVLEAELDIKTNPFQRKISVKPYGVFRSEGVSCCQLLLHGNYGFCRIKRFPWVQSECRGECGKKKKRKRICCGGTFS